MMSPSTATLVRRSPQTAAAPPPQLPTATLAGLTVHHTTLDRSVAHILNSLAAGVGGWVLTPNVDILRRWTRNPDFRRTTAGVTLCIADGMPLVWASRLSGQPLPERITGADLTRELAKAAAAAGRSLFFLGGAPGAGEAAVRQLLADNPALQIAGHYCPPFGFENDPLQWEAMAAVIATTQPDLIFVGLGSPKQELTIARLQSVAPSAWWLGVGVTFSFLGGQISRAPRWMQRCGLEWFHRLLCEPKRLAKRYLVDDVPFAAALLMRAAIDGLRRRPAKSTTLVPPPVTTRTE